MNNVSLGLLGDDGFFASAFGFAAAAAAAAGAGIARQGLRRAVGRHPSWGPWVDSAMKTTNLTVLGQVLHCNTIDSP